MAFQGIDPQTLRRLVQQTMSQQSGVPQQAMGKAPGAFNIMTALMPGVSDVRDIAEVTTGKDVMTGQPLTEHGRILQYLAAALPFISGGMMRMASGFKELPKMPKSLEALYDEVFNGLPESIRKKTKVKSVRIAQFPPDMEGEGGRLIVDKKGDYHVVLEEGEENLKDVLRHELLHAFAYDNPDIIKGTDFFREEKAVHDIEKSLKTEDIIDLTPEMEVKKVRQPAINRPQKMKLQKVHPKLRERIKSVGWNKDAQQAMAQTWIKEAKIDKASLTNNIEQIKKGEKSDLVIHGQRFNKSNVSDLEHVLKNLGGE